MIEQEDKVQVFIQTDSQDWAEFKKLCRSIGMTVQGAMTVAYHELFEYMKEHKTTHGFRHGE